MATVAGFQTIGVNSLTPHIGAEIEGVDLAKDLSNEQFSEIYQAWLDWKIVVFRDQEIDRNQHKAFARKFGSLHVHPMQHSYGGDPEILTVKTTKDSAYTAGNGWHTDVTCDKIPPLGSMLYMKQTPAGGGGDTLYADMYLAYEMLSETMRGLLDGLPPLDRDHDGANADYFTAQRRRPRARSRPPGAPGPMDLPVYEHTAGAGITQRRADLCLYRRGPGCRSRRGSVSRSRRKGRSAGRHLHCAAPCL